jgi:hypothetical protein
MGGLPDAPALRLRRVIISALLAKPSQHSAMRSIPIFARGFFIVSALAWVLAASAIQNAGLRSFDSIVRDPMPEVSFPVWRNCSIFSRYRCVENWVASRWQCPRGLRLLQRPWLAPVRVDHSAGRGRCQGSGAVSLHQHDLPHRTAGHALDPGRQFDPPCPSAAAVVLQAAN